MIKRIFHIALRVKHLERSMEFYKNVLGMKIVSQENVQDKRISVTFLRFGDCEIEMFSDGISESFADDAFTHFPHLAFEVDDVAKAMSELQDRGVVFDHSKPQLIFNQRVEYNTFKGPDGEILEISRRLY